MKNNAPVRGTKDYLPYEQSLREYVKSVILKTYKSYGFMQIGTPILENIENLLDSDGGDNVKLIFKVLKRGEKLDLSKPNLVENDLVDIGLKYDQTVPLARMFANNQNDLPQPFKSIQIDYSFRAERPQLGRDRQFLQCDIDILGDASINAEIDIINTSAKAFSNLGFNNVTAKVNDRRILTDLVNFVGFEPFQESQILISLDKLDKIGFEGVEQELVQKGFEKQKITRFLNIIQDITTKNALDVLQNYGVRQQVIEEIKKVISTLNNLSSNGFKAIFDISIIRGQGYYTGLVFEMFVPGLSSACGGGGRYDKMIEKMTGKPIPAVGFGLGFERVCLLVKDSGMFTQNEQAVAVLYEDTDDFVDVLKFIETINNKINASAVPMKKNIGHQLEVLKQNGFTHYCKFKEKQLKQI